MSVIYKTREGETIDMICQNYYGATSGVVERVIEANRGIEDLPELLPAGIDIILPDAEANQVSLTKTIRLWD